MANHLTRLFRLGLFLPVLFFVFETPLRAQIMTLKDCETCVSGKVDELLRTLDKAEDYLMQYRWAEERIREIYYDRLWKARRNANDPFSSNLRKIGDQDEAYWLSRLAPLERQSKDGINGIYFVLEDVKNADQRLGSCCQELLFRRCVSEPLAALYKKMDEIYVQLIPILEHEREFRLAVSEAVGKRSGLYPRDTVEEPISHDEFYWRFEVDRRKVIFDEDRKLLFSLDEARKYVRTQLPVLDCCHKCSLLGKDV